MNELTTISKLKQARLVIREVRGLDEIKGLIDQSEALKSYARAQQLSQEVKDDIAEYNLYATRQMGAISAGLEPAPKGNRYTGKVELPDGGSSKTDTLAAAGIDIRRANEAEKLAAVPEDRFAEIIAEKKETGELTKAAVMDAATKPHVAKNSGNNEWYTPKEYIEAARAVMGGIDYDPASSEAAQETVRATRYDTIDTDGLQSAWYGRVWLNPPYSANLVSRFITKLKGHIEQGDVTQAVVLVNNATETSWFCELISVASAIVFPSSRIKYKTPEDRILGTPLQGQAFVYIGYNADDFFKRFSPLGWGAFLA